MLISNLVYNLKCFRVIYNQQNNQVPHAGSVYDKLPIVMQMLKSGMATAGCATIEALHRDAVLELQSNVSLDDSGVHDMSAIQSIQEFGIT